MTNIAKIFTTGKSQAVRLPKKFRFTGTEVLISRDAAGRVILTPMPTDWHSFFTLVDRTEIPDSFLADRDQPLLQERELL
jgi:antitoxin VapB